MSFKSVVVSHCSGDVPFFFLRIPYNLIIIRKLADALRGGAGSLMDNGLPGGARAASAVVSQARCSNTLRRKINDDRWLEASFSTGAPFRNTQDTYST